MVSVSFLNTIPRNSRTPAAKYSSSPAKKITFTTRGKEYVVDYLIPGTYNYAGKDVAVDSGKFPYTFAMHYDMGYTEARVEGYGTTSNGFARHYVWARDWVLYLNLQ